MRWAGVTSAAFVSAAYDILSGISALTDRGLADMTAAATVVARATRSEIGTMTNLFAGAYGTFRRQFEDMTDSEWGDMFGATLSAAVQQFRTDGAAMLQSIESAGSEATKLGLSMAGAVGGVARLGGGLLGLVNPLNGVSGAFAVLRGAIAASGVGLIVLALAAAGTWIYNNWSGLGAMFSAFGSAFMEALGPARPVIDAIADAIGAVWGWVTNLLGPLDASAERWASWGEAAGAVLGGAVAAVANFAGQVAGWFADLPSLDWSGVVDIFTWETVLTALDWATWLSPIRWVEFIPGFEWSGVVSLAGLRQIWSDVVAFFTDWAWVDILPKWEWSALIPDLPDFSGLFGGAERTLDVRLNDIAIDGWNWDRGIDLVEQYRAGLIDLVDLRAQLAEEVRLGSDDAAREMLAELNAELQISDPQSLLEAAEAADALQERFPAISAAATEGLAATSSVIAQITASLAALDYADEGARFVASIAEGIGLVAHWFHLKGRVAILETKQDIQSKHHEDTLDRIDRKLERIERKLDGKVDK